MTGAAAGGTPSSGGWPSETPGRFELPSGRVVRGRGLRRPPPAGPAPDFGLYLLGRAPEPTPWSQRWLRWPDFRLPTDRQDAAEALYEVWERAAEARVEIACGGGIGRTGTALALLAVIDGVPPDRAVAHVRQHYHPRAVETLWQRRYVQRWPASRSA